MSAPVDVIAVLDSAYEAATNHEALARLKECPGHACVAYTSQRNLLKARFAVAELIEAVSQVYGGEGHADKESCAPGCMSCRIQIAVARCIGESE